MNANLHSHLLRLSINVAACLALALCAAAETFSFDSGTDLASYTMHRSNTAAVTVTEGAGSGAGNPASGGLTFLSTTTANSTALLLRPDVTGAAGLNYWQATLLVNPRETDDHASGEKKTETRFGFTATKNLPTDITKLNEFFHKTNHGISVHFKADHTVGSTDKIRRLEVQLTNNNGTDTNYGKVTLNSSAHFDDWLRVTLTVTRAGTTTFNATYLLESLGPDGTSAPAQLGTHTQNGLANANLANAATIHTGFTLNGDKQANTRLYADEHTVTLSNLPPAAPTALAASTITSTGFTANWQPGTGLPGTDYVLEATSAADNFTSGSYLTATGGTSTSGIVISGSATTSQTLTGLSPLTSYVYRVKAINSAGSSVASNVITATTIAGNAPPAFDAIPNQPPVRPTDGAKTVTLTGITAGGEPGQIVTLSATSSNPAILPHPSINYTPTAPTATLTYDPNGAGTGDVTITVTANDGQAENNLFQRTFIVPVQFPVPLLGFESDGELLSLGAVPVNGTLTRTAGVGLGSPASDGLVFQRTGSTGNETGAALWRVQPYDGVTATNLSSAIFFNPREVDDLATKDKIEVNLGFAGAVTVNTSKPQEFLRKTNPGISVKLSAEHDPSDASKIRKLEGELTSWDGFIESKGSKITLLNQTDALNHWLKLVFAAVRTGPTTYQLSYRLEDWGVNGTTLAGVLIEGAALEVSNPALANDAEIWSGVALSTEKTGVARAYLDLWETTIGENPPAAPLALNAVQVTSTGFLAKWTAGAGVFATGYVLEASTAASNFAPGTFLTATGGTSAGGIAVSGAAARSFRITGLNPGTSYVYRVRAINMHGTSAASNVTALTTLAPGANAVPTLDPIANPPALNINASEQSIPLTGISAGGEIHQTATVTAVSSNPTLVPDPFVNYSDPDDTGTLYFAPNAGETGTAVITVTVTDDHVPPASFSRQLTVTVIEPETLVAFNDAAALDRFELHHFLGSSFAYGAGAGVGSPSGGGGIYTRTGSLESVLVAYRPTAYDALVSPHYTASLFINAREIVNLTSGKDKAELRLAFTGDKTPNAASPKDSMNKTHPALGITFKVEHEFNKPDKDRKMEVECFSWNGTTEAKGGKTSAVAVAATAHWLKVTLYVMRGGQDQYYIVYDVADWGVNGTAWQAQVLTGGPFLATNAPFFNDSSVYAGFSLTSEKTSTKNIYLDNHEVSVNTTAADPPLPLAAANVRAREFTAQWAPSLLGHAPTGYVLDITTQASNFAPGTFISATGVGGQSAGIQINSATTTALTITGLVPNQNYVYRVRAKRGTEQSASIGQTFVTTLATDFAFWRETYFPTALGNPAISGPNADPDGDGQSNLLEYALGSHPLIASTAGLPSFSYHGAYLRMTFLRRVNAPDVIYQPQSSGSLTSGFGPDVTEISASAPDAEGLQIVVVEDNVAMTEAPQRFMRLRVQSVP
jgi:hypothetical protein